MCCVCVWPKDGKLYKVILWFCVVGMLRLCFCFARVGLLFLSSPSTRFASDLKRAPACGEENSKSEPGISALQSGSRTPILGFTFPNWNPFECVDFKVNCLGLNALLSSRAPNWTKQTRMPREVTSKYGGGGGGHKDWYTLVVCLLVCSGFIGAAVSGLARTFQLGWVCKYL